MAGTAVLALLLALSTLAALQGSQKPGTDSLFAPAQVFEARLEAPFTQLLEQGRKDPRQAVKGKLTYKDAAGREQSITDVSITLRGNTSRQDTECDFPKLKLTFSGPTPPPFDGKSAVKVGTHCADKPDGELTPKYGRWANEKAPQREAAVYRVLAAAGVPTLQARPARLTYVFTDTKDPPLVRNAFLLEDDDELMERVGANGEVTEKQFTSAREAFSAADGARVAFAQAMIANFDWCLRYFGDEDYRCNQRHPLWNVLALKTGDRLSPFIYDFDLSGFVTGRHLWFKHVLNPAFSANAAEHEVEVLVQLQRTRSLYSREVLDATRAEFVRRKAAIYEALNTSPLDEGWKPRIEAYLNAFFAAIEKPEQFYRPAIVATDVRFYTDPNGSTPACGDDTAPIGTVVSAPLETRGQFMKVVVLDTWWRWAPPNKCDAVHNSPVWVSSTAVSTGFPK